MAHANAPQVWHASFTRKAARVRKDGNDLFQQGAQRAHVLIVSAAAALCGGGVSRHKRARRTGQSRKLGAQPGHLLPSLII